MGVVGVGGVVEETEEGDAGEKAEGERDIEGGVVVELVVDGVL